MLSSQKNSLWSAAAILRGKELDEKVLGLSMHSNWGFTGRRIPSLPILGMFVGISGTDAVKRLPMQIAIMGVTMWFGALRAACKPGKLRGSL